MEVNNKVNQAYSGNGESLINPEDILSSAGFIISVGPSRYDSSKDNWQDSLIPIGLVQSYYMSSAKNVQTIYELGTRKKTVVASKGPKQLMLTRVMTYNKNVLASLYSYNEKVGDVPTKIYDLGGEQSIKTIGIVLTLLTEGRDIIGHMYFQDVLIESHAENRTAGERGVMEQIAAKWSNYKFITG